MEPARFIAELNIRSMTDLEAIKEADLWAQYLKGNGTVWANLDYLGGKSLRFNVVGTGPWLVAIRWIIAMSRMGSGTMRCSLKLM